ncbi:MAG: ABC transporter ATP-binding protein [Candidatus Omnitrophica bacterium]|nr:ABC transporter ATP-binding protein [Candidatus Omnitrophota bacterium]
MKQAILEARAVSKRFIRREGWLRRQTGWIQAVEKANLTLQAGETLGLVGESGSGKSTLCKLLIGLLRPTEGDTLLQGRSLKDWNRLDRQRFKRQVQFVFQDPINSLNPRMSVEAIVSEPLRIHRLVDKTTLRLRVTELLESVQLPPSYRSRIARQLSGGERQRIGIARALGTSPSVLICDEPIASLDIAVGVHVLHILRELNQKHHVAILFASHDLRAVAWLCEKVAVMHDGRIVESGPTQTVLTHPRHPYTELLIRSAQLDLDMPLAL